MKYLYSVLVLCLALATPASAEKKFSFEFLLGTAYNFETPMKIEQDGEEDVSLNNTRWDTKPLEESPYYMWRIGMWGGDGNAWELELLHHKLYLANTPDEVDAFNISHGYNLLMINRAWDMDGAYHLRIGAGVVVAHPELDLRGEAIKKKKTLGTDFVFAGPAMQIAAGKRFYFTKKLFGVVETKFTAAYADVGMEGASAEVPNIAIHVLLGLGFDYSRN